jgi:putative transposase
MEERRALVSEKEDISVRKQCELLAVNRSSVYYKPVGESPENLELMRLMDAYFLEHPTYGVLQMQDYLFLLGFVVNVKKVRRLLRLMGIEALYPKRNLSKLGKAQYKRPYLLKGLQITRPNQVWAIDITYVPMDKGFMYLVAIIDVYSRFVVGWGVHNTLDAQNSLDVLKEAIAKHGKPEIVNSDQGSQYTSKFWTEYLDNQDIKISMDGKGRATDNIFIERFWRTVKQDYVYKNPAPDGLELFRGLQKFTHHYNFEKTHQGIGRKTPSSLYVQSAA